MDNYMQILLLRLNFKEKKGVGVFYSSIVIDKIKSKNKVCVLFEDDR